MNTPIPPTSASARLADDEIFPAADYEHRLRLGRCLPAAFFQPWESHPAPHSPTELIAERRRWIRDNPERHVLALDSASAALAELAEHAQSWTGMPLADPAPSDSQALPLATAIGGSLEADFALLSVGSGSPRLIAGCVCFPSSWAPEEKLGRSLDRIHEVVPDLNPTLGHAIEGFLARLKPGTAWIRANWGLSASPERNQHPARQLPRLRTPLDPGATWVRIEHQAVLILPRSGALLFGIRIDQRPLTAFASQPSVARALAGALRSMPGPMAAYKGLHEVREAVADYLLAAPSPPLM